MGSGRRCVIAKSNLLPTNGRVYRFLSFNWPDQRLMRNNRRITTEGNSFSVILKGFFSPCSIIFFNLSFTGALFPFRPAAGPVPTCTSLHGTLGFFDPAARAHCEVGSGWQAGELWDCYSMCQQGSLPQWDWKVAFPPAARTPAHTADRPWQCEPSSVSLTCRVGQLLLRLPFPCTMVIWSVLHLDLSFKTDRVESLKSLT